MRDKKGQYKIIKISPRRYNNCEYAPSIAFVLHSEELLTVIKGEIDSNTIVGSFNTPLTSMDRSRQKINKETQALNDTLDQMDTALQNLRGHRKSNFKKEVYSKTILLQETRKISSKQPSLTAKATRERKTKFKISRNHKDRSRNKWRQ